MSAVEQEIIPWASLSPEVLYAELETLAGRDPRVYPFGILVQSAPSVFSWAFYWFASLEERNDFLVHLEVANDALFDMGLEPEELDALRARVAALGAGPGRVDGLPYVNDSSVDWIGTFHDLRFSSEDGCVKCRDDFWRVYGDDESDAYDESDDTIPDASVDDFIDSLSGY